MRDYAKISPQFWLGKTGRCLRGSPEAQLVALYLLSCPHANMIGVFHCPIIYIAHETGLPFEGASKGLTSLEEADFCTYEAAEELVFVHEMARYQIGDELKPTDNRVKGAQNEYDRIPDGQLKQAFHAKYQKAFHLPEILEICTDFEGASKGLASQEQKQEQEQEQKQESASRTPAPTGTSAGSACRVMKAVGLVGVNPSHPDLVSLLAAGVEEQVFADTAAEAMARGRGFPWVLAAIRGRMADAAATPTPAPKRAPKAEKFEQINYGNGGPI